MSQNPLFHADLHCHTERSDGAATLNFLTARAEANGVTHLAITDHDCTSLDRPLQVCESVCLIGGVEISCEVNDREIHVVGLLVDPQNARLQALLQRQQQARRERLSAMASKLANRNLGGLEGYLARLPAVAYTRSHAANFLVQAGHVKNRQKAFKQYLAKGAMAYVAPNWCELTEAIDCIHESGGVAILAHPGRYPLNRKQLEQLIESFAAAGGDAIETRYPNIDANMSRRLDQAANQWQLRCSVGSDFHDPAAQWTDVGKFPRLGSSQEPAAVWHHPRWRQLVS